MRKTLVNQRLIYDVKPIGMSSIFKETPEISANLLGQCLKLDTTEMYLDEQKVFSNIFNNKIVYIPLIPLKFGEHYVRIKVNTIHGDLVQKSWCFLVENPELEYNFYYGIPHAHTEYSDGIGTPIDAYEHAREKGLNFLVVTDHSNFLDGVKNHNYEYDRKTDQYIEKKNSEWYKTRIEAETINSKYGDFLALRGFEMSSSTGHINVINTSSYVEGKRQIKNSRKFFNWLYRQQNSVVAINHPDKSFKRLFKVSNADEIVSVMEVGNGSYPHKYKNKEKYYFNALDMGWHVGAVNGQDNHLNNWGDSDNLTAIIAPYLSKEQFIQALRSRRTYSTETRSLKLIFKVNGYWMGSIINGNTHEKLNFQIIAEDSNVPIKKIQLISNNGKVLKEEIFDQVFIANWCPSLKIGTKNSWYVVKIIHQDNRCAISSPIFFKI